ncbi:hypothetical protein BVC80_715g64 [Macleaya cordata]|uniref:Uncharacterized protein n=1 Tax=Macleaya cordata TaxID=56857 RepID=A0A200PMB9_MACCD|nr:hypothetical protein BVC80_715g64 [Macleaya cordata]
MDGICNGLVRDIQPRHGRWRSNHQRRPWWRNGDDVLKFVLPIVVGLLGLKFEGNTNKPFDTHPLLMTLSVFALLTHFVLSSSSLHPRTKNINEVGTVVVVVLRDVSGSLATSL